MPPSNNDLRRNNHYVPTWYQRGFLPPDQGEHYVLNKSPNRWTTTPHGRRILIRDKPVRPRGPLKFLRLTDLYTTTALGRPNDAIESRLWGRIDHYGAKAVTAFLDFPHDPGIHHRGFEKIMSHGDPHEHMSHLVEYLDAQKIRTPKGLARLRLQVDGIATQNQLMKMMLTFRQFYMTTWAEGLWEIVTANNSSIKFIFSDDPVTIYNCDHYPGAESCTFPNDPHPYEIGSRTIFPLTMNQCLIISNIEHGKSPSRKNARRHRRNARSYQTPLISILDVHKNRALGDREVAAINYIVKSRAVQFVAAADERWLFPENVIGRPVWHELDAVFQPTGHARKLNMTDMIVKYEDESILFSNQYGEHQFVPGWYVKAKKAKPGRKHP